MSDLSNRAAYLMVQGNLQEALRVARQAARELPGDWHAHCVLGQCLQNSDDIAGALDELRNL